MPATQSPVSCQLGSALSSTPPVDASKALAGKVVCACTLCQGPECETQYWLPAAARNCPGPPRVPGSAEPVFWGRWCHSNLANGSPGPVYGTTGYTVGADAVAACVTADGTISNAADFSVWCPGGVKACSGVPTDPITNGSWPVDCTGLAVCAGSCLPGNTGMPASYCVDGKWGPVTGSCAATNNDVCGPGACGGGECIPNPPGSVPPYTCSCPEDEVPCSWPGSDLVICGRCAINGVCIRMCG